MVAPPSTESVHCIRYFMTSNRGDITSFSERSMSIFELQYHLKLLQLSKYAVLIFCFSIIIPFSRFIKCFVNLQNSTVARDKIKYYLPLV